MLREPIIKVLFQRGAFDSVATVRTAEALLYYCLGLWPIAAARILVAGFYSLQGTKTPVKLSFVAFIANVILSLVLMGPMRHSGLALANSLSALLNVVMLFYCCKQRVGGWNFNWVRETVGKVFLAGTVMGFCLWLVMTYVVWDNAGGLFFEFLQLIFTIGLGGLVYLIMCRILNVRELETVTGILTRRGRKSE